MAEMQGNGDDARPLRERIKILHPNIYDITETYSAAKTIDELTAAWRATPAKIEELKKLGRIEAGGIIFLRESCKYYGGLLRQKLRSGQ